MTKQKEFETIKKELQRLILDINIKEAIRIYDGLNNLHYLLIDIKTEEYKRGVEDLSNTLKSINR